MLGFLSPFGKFFKCGYFEHMSLADTLLKDVYKEESNNPVDKLCKHGWVAIQSSFIGFAGDNTYHTPQLTFEQKEWLKDHEDIFSYDQKIGLQMCIEINDMLYEK